MISGYGVCTKSSLFPSRTSGTCRWVLVAVLEYVPQLLIFSFFKQFATLDFLLISSSGSYIRDVVSASPPPPPFFLSI